jgi:hypothetical protein
MSATGWWLNLFHGDGRGIQLRLAKILGGKYVVIGLAENFVRCETAIWSSTRTLNENMSISL